MQTISSKLYKIVLRSECFHRNIPSMDHSFSTYANFSEKLTFYPLISTPTCTGGKKC